MGRHLVALRAGRDDRLCLPPLEPEDSDPLGDRPHPGRSWLCSRDFAFAFHAAEAAASAPGASAEAIRTWASKSEGLGPYPPARLAEILARYRGDYAGIVDHMLHDERTESARQSLAIVGWETLAYMLLGMAALKTGFLTGAWSNRDYRKVALIGFGIGVPVYAVLAWLIVREDFSVNAHRRSSPWPAPSRSGR